MQTKCHTHVHEGRAENIPDRVAPFQHFNVRML